MAIAEYQGPQNHVGMLKHFVGEKIKCCFVDGAGHLWCIVESGHAIVFAGFDPTAAAFAIEQPQRVTQELDKRRSELQGQIQQLKFLAPGVDL